MCIFTGPVRSVHKTRILVSPLPNNRQLIVYENHVEQNGKNAMVLPVPNGSGAGAGEINLIDLSKYQGNVWKDCESMFPQYTVYGASAVGVFGGFGSQSSKAPPLPVQRVGGYSCTIVPTLEDFGRVSKDVFYLPPDIEAILREHYPQGFSFVVCLFQGNVAAHPIAYSSGRLANGQLFVPTRHAHGGGATHLHLGGEPVHVGIRCDVCGVVPLIGHRWKCSQCQDYDMCNSCYMQRRDSHHVEHSFLHITAPNQVYRAPPEGFKVMRPNTRGGFVFDASEGGGDAFDHTLYLINCVLAAAPSRYDTLETCIPHNKSALYQLHVPLAECATQVNIKGNFPNKDYYCTEIQ